MIFCSLAITKIQLFIEKLLFLPFYLGVGNFSKEIIHEPDDIQTRVVFECFLSNHNGNVWLGENIIAYRNIDDYWRIRKAIEALEKEKMIDKVRLVREMSLWALCYDCNIERTLCLESKDGYCLFESYGGVVEVLETGGEGDKLKDETVQIEYVDSTLPLFVLGAMIYYKTWYKKAWNADILLLDSFPFPIDVCLKKGNRVRDYFSLIQKNTTTPHKHSRIIDCSDSELELRMENYKCCLDIADIFGFIPISVELTIDIDVRQNILLIFKDIESGIEKEMSLPIFEKNEVAPLCNDSRQAQIKQSRLTDPIKKKQSLKAHWFNIFGKK